MRPSLIENSVWRFITVIFFDVLLCLIFGLLFFSNASDAELYSSKSEIESCSPLLTPLHKRALQFLTRSSDPKSELLRNTVLEIYQSTTTVWTGQFQFFSLTPYHPPQVVFYKGKVQSGCGKILKHYGPVYCTEDETLYFDLSYLLSDLNKMKVHPVLALQFIVAHEVGHHVQKLFKIQRRFLEITKDLNNIILKAQYRIQVELQADCLAGAWLALNQKQRAQKSQKLFDEEEIDEVIKTVRLHGEDEVQQTPIICLNIEECEHGNSVQRVKAFREGLVNANLRYCLDSYYLSGPGL